MPHAQNAHRSRNCSARGGTIKLHRVVITLFAVCALAFGFLPAQAPAGATAKCGDGTYSKAQSKQGACSHHKGVAEWYGAGGNTSAKPAKGQVPTANAGLPAGAPQDATALCNDNTYSSSQHRSGTCSHHGGVKKWLKEVPN